jgi:gas vesicle protein
MSYGKVFLGLLTGTAIGATLGILFAPDKGSATRKKIGKKKDEYSEALETNFNRVVDNVSKKFEATAEDANRFANKAKHKVDQI